MLPVVLCVACLINSAIKKVGAKSVTIAIFDE